MTKFKIGYFAPNFDDVVRLWGVVRDFGLEDKLDISHCRTPSEISEVFDCVAIHTELDERKDLGWVKPILYKSLMAQHLIISHTNQETSAKELGFEFIDAASRSEVIAQKLNELIEKRGKVTKVTT